MQASIHNTTRQQPSWQLVPVLVLVVMLLQLATPITAQELEGGLSTLAGPSDNVIIVDGFVDTTTCYEHLLEADANGNNDGKVQAEEYVEFTQHQTPGGQLDGINSYPQMPLAMQATFVLLTCLCRDERFGGDSRDVNCCLGTDAHIAILGHDEDASSQEKARLFATCFLTDEAIITVLGSEPPSASPTETPTTVAPTSMAPITGPPVTASPTSLAPTTVAPSAAPTPTTATPGPTSLSSENAEVVYTISVENGVSESIPNSAYEDDLVLAMNALAGSVAASVFTSSAAARNGGGRMRNRKLQTMVQLPTVVSAFEVTECNPGLANPTFDRCENIGHTVTLVDDTADVSEQDVTDFEIALLDAIVRGELQQNLPAGSSVRILTGLTPAETDRAVAQDDEGLPGGATAGIVIGALVVAILPIALYLSMRRTQEEKEPYGAYEPHEAGSAEIGGQPEESDVEAITKGVQANLGASPTDYGKSYSSKAPPKTEFQPLHKVPPVSPDRVAARKGDRDGDDNSSSNAGSSGWSSSAGLSSMNTGSAEDSMEHLLNSPTGASLAALGAASAVARQVENRRTISPMGTGMEDLDVPAGAVSRNDLDNAIEAGDWAAVGATAALLAAASDSQSASSRSRASRSNAGQSQGTSVSSVDAARAAELDHLVDAGDWEGVVLAAAKFESQEGSVKSGTASSVRSSSVGSETRSGTGSGFTPSVSTSVSESASKARKRDEIRQEVEALVRRVVPEELDNVDEMMMQFKGREEELVETLRTMQERAVAQKARSAGHKAAKQEARRTVKRGGMPGAALEDFSSAASNSAATAGQSSVSPPGEVDGPPRQRTALEEAIEAGDWEAVGEAAALMSDASVTSASTADLERRAAGERLGAGSTSSARSLRITGVNIDRARELDELIDRGNWTAVVDAAGRFSQADKDASIASSVESPAKRTIASAGSGSAGSGSKRHQQSKEEEDALAQAEIWMQIAAQSKAEGGNDTGASDAADWAIARSLKSLKTAEERGEGGSTGGSKQGSHKSAADDDESV